MSSFVPPLHLSPSSIGTFNDCPLKFRYNKIDMLPDPSNHWAVLGNLVHDILEDVYKLPAEMRTQENAKSIATKMWKEKWEEEIDRILPGFKSWYKINTKDSRVVINTFKRLALNCVENLWEIENPQQIEPIGLEYELNGEIAGVRLKGFIDRYSQTEGKTSLTISDYKSGKTPREYDLDGKFSQLLIYAKLIMNLGIGDVDKLELMYLAEPIKFVKEVTHSDISRLEEMIVETKSKIDERCRNQYFEPIKSGLCNFCNYKMICPAWGG